VQAWLKEQLGLSRSRFRNPPGGFDAVEDCVDAARITPLTRFDPRRVSLHTFHIFTVPDMCVLTSSTPVATRPEQNSCRKLTGESLGTLLLVCAARERVLRSSCRSASAG